MSNPYFGAISRCITSIEAKLSAGATSCQVERMDKPIRISEVCLGCGESHDLAAVESRKIPRWPRVSWMSGPLAPDGEQPFCPECHAKLMAWEAKHPTSWCFFTQVDEAFGEPSWWTLNHGKRGYTFEGESEVEVVIGNNTGRVK